MQPSDTFVGQNIYDIDNDIIWWDQINKKFVLYLNKITSNNSLLHLIANKNTFYIRNKTTGKMGVISCNTKTMEWSCVTVDGPLCKWMVEIITWYTVAS